jgi:hypothetical protein
VFCADAENANADNSSAPTNKNAFKFFIVLILPDKCQILPEAKKIARFTDKIQNGNRIIPGAAKIKLFSIAE